MKLPVAPIAVILLLLRHPAFAAEPIITQDELVRRTQELMDAVATGNKQPWQQYYAEDCIFAAELLGRNQG